MCLGIPGKIVELHEANSLPMGRVDYGGVIKEACLAYVPQARPGDYVIVHVHAVREPGTRGNAIIDIFRLENGKVVEHWDVIQPVPEKAANNNGMF